MHESQEWRELSPEDPASLALTADWNHQLARAGVDWSEAVETVFQMSPTTETELPDGSVEVGVTLDTSGILATLRDLPDGAGTAAFLAAFRARFTQADPPPT